MVEKQTILIIDGVEKNREIIKNILGPVYNYYEAENGADALALLERYHNDLNLVLLEMDLELEIVSGFEILEWLKQQSWSYRLPVIMMADRTVRLSKIEPAYKMGVLDNIMRPFSELSLQNRIRTILGLYSAMAALEFRADHDELTGLLNEQAFAKETEKFIFPFNAHKYFMALVNVDFFKRMIISRGHAFGDKVLKTVAAKLKELYGEDALLARKGGDEFLVFLPTNYNLEEVCTQMKKELDFVIDDQKVGTSIGIAELLLGVNFEEMLNRADKALFHAKDEGRGCYRVYKNE